MPEVVFYAIIYFTLALVFYSIGVLSERIKKRSFLWHLLFFWLGLVADTLGTIYVGKQSGGFNFNFHTITGTFGLLLMLVHTLWATFILLAGTEKQLINFHKFSFFVWLIWLIPYFTGLVSGMTK